MCLEVVVLFPRGEKQKPKADQMSVASGLHVVAFHTDDGREGLHLSGSGGCSCDLKAGGHGGEPTAWMLEPGRLKDLEKAVSLIAASSRGFSFRAEWLGPDGRSTRREIVSLGDLVKNIRGNGLRDGVEYVVTG